MPVLVERMCCRVQVSGCDRILPEISNQLEVPTSPLDPTSIDVFYHNSISQQTGWEGRLPSKYAWTRSNLPERMLHQLSTAELQGAEGRSGIWGKCEMED